MAGERRGPLDETLAVFDRMGAAGEPLTTREVTERLDCTRRAAYDRLQRLVDRGALDTKKVGARGRVWWPASTSAPADERGPRTGTHTRLQERQFESLVDAVSEYALFALDAEGRVVSWNQGAERIKGYEADEVLGTHVSVFYPAAERAEGVPADNLATAAATGSIEETGWRVRKDGSRFRARVTLTALTDEAGDLTGYVKVTRDMTRQHRYEERLARQRDELRRELDEVFDRIDDGFFAVDESFRITYLNDRAAALLGGCTVDALGETLWDVTTTLSESELRGQFERAVEGQEPTDCTRYLEGSDRWVAMTIYPSETGSSVYVRDVTARRERERELERYEAVVETIGDGVYIVDDESRFLLVNDAHTELTGYDREELLGAHASLVTTAADLTLAERQRDELERGGGGVTTVETELRTKDGERLPIETRFALFPVGTERSGRVGVVRDISARKKRERELRARIRQQEAVTELGQLALECHDLDRLMHRASELVAETLDSDYCKVLDLDDEGESLLLRQGVGWNDGIVGTASVSAVDDDSQAAHTLRTEQPVVVEDLGTERRFSGPELLTAHDVVSGISTIIGSFGAPWGILGTHDTGRRTFTEHDVNFVQSVAHILSTAIDRSEYERELKQYETIVETIDDGVYVLDGDHRFTKANRAYLAMMGYDREELLGAPCSLVVGETVSEEAAERSTSLVDTGEHATLEAEIEREDGSRFVAESRFTPLPVDAETGNDDPSDASSVGTVGVVRDTTERRQYERALERQREQLAALNDLRGVIGGIVDAVIAQSTREEVERVVCDRLADADTYQFAWIGEVDRSADVVRVKATSGRRDLEGTDVSVGDETTSGYGEMVDAAIRTETVVVRRRSAVEASETTTGAHDDVTGGPFEASSAVQSAAAIPIVHDGMVFGVVVISTERPDAFENDEQTTIDHLGESIGHAIASIERKRALMSDEVVELHYRTGDLSTALGLSSTLDGEISFDRTVPAAEGRYLTYGTVTDDAIEALETASEADPGWEELTVTERERDVNSFELVLSEPPVTSVVAGQGGEVVSARIADGTFELVVHLPPSADVRAISEVVTAAHPSVELMARRQVSRVDPDIEGLLTEELTDRQRAALDASYQAGFFEWPRTSSGEEVAASLDISPSTFHQHLRVAERKVFESILS